MGAIAFQFRNQRMGYFLAIAQNLISLCGSLCLCGEKTNESTTETQRTQRNYHLTTIDRCNKIVNKLHKKTFYYGQF